MKTHEIAINNLLDKIKGSECLFSGPKRLECRKAIRLPFSSHPIKVKPQGWCEVCWLKYQNSVLKKENDNFISLVSAVSGFLEEIKSLESKDKILQVIDDLNNMVGEEVYAGVKK